MEVKEAGDGPFLEVSSLYNSRVVICDRRAFIRSSTSGVLSNSRLRRVDRAQVGERDDHRHGLVGHPAQHRAERNLNAGRDRDVARVDRQLWRQHPRQRRPHEGGNNHSHF